MEVDTFRMQRPPLLRRLGWKLLPPTRLNVGVPHPLPDGFEDAITVETEVQLGVKDRLRVLLQGRLLVQSITLTEHNPGRCESLSSVSTV